MAKKDIIIQLLQEDGGTTATTITTTHNLVTNPDLNPTLNQPNVFQINNAYNDPLPQGAAVVAAPAFNTWWNGWSQGTGSTIASSTARPSSNGSGHITFHPVSGGTLTEEVTNWDFSANIIAGTYTDTTLTSPWTAMQTFFAGGNTGIGSGWYVWNTSCNALQLSTLMPAITTSGGTSGGYMRMSRGSNPCSGAGIAGESGIIQNVNLTNGTVYKIRIKLKTASPIPGGWLYFGVCRGVQCASNTYGGSTINSLGFRFPFVGASLYGTWANGGGPGNCACGGNTGSGVFVRADTTAEQSAVFTSRGGHEAIVITYHDQSQGQATNIEIDYVSIKEDEPEATSLSGIYQKLINVNQTITYDLSIRVESAPTGPNGAEIIVGWLEQQYQDNDPYSAQLTNPTQWSQMYVWADNPNGNAGLPTSFPATLQTTVTYSNNSWGAFSAGDRFMGVSVLNNTNQETIISNVSYTWKETVDSEGQDSDLNTYGELEVSNSQDFPLNISYTVSDGKDLESRFGDYSQSFDIPASKKNNKTLNRLWKPTMSDTQKTYGIKPCRILVNGTPFFDGSLQVKKSTQTSKPKSYSCTIYGGNFSWMTLLKDLELCSLFDDSDTFLYDLPTIEATWPLVQSQTDVQYPLISYGRFWDDGVAPIQNWVNVYDDTATPDWRPSFYVYNMFMKIFNNIGYKVSSAYLNSPQFKTLINHFPFIDNEAMDKSELYKFEVEKRSTSAGGTVQAFNGGVALGLWSALNAAGWETILFDDVVSDPANQYTAANGQFLAKISGSFDFWASGGYGICDDEAFCCGSGSCAWDYNGVDRFDAWIWKTRIKVTPVSGPVYYINGNPGNSAGHQLSIFFCTNESSPNSTCNVSGSATLAIGDIVEVQMAFGGGSPPATCEPDVLCQCFYDANYSNPGQPRFRAEFINPVPQLGDLIPKNRILPCGVSQVDYIKSIAHLFNLYFTTDVISKIVYIEPFNDFFKPTSEGVNWEQKIDYSQEINDNYDVGLKRELQIGYKEDSNDGYLKVRNIEAGNYGGDRKLFNYYENLGQDYAPGELEMINPIFAATTQVWDNDVLDVQGNCAFPLFIPNIWTEDAFSGLGLNAGQWRPPTTFRYEPRILYYHWEDPDDDAGGSGVTQLQTNWSYVDSGGTQWPCARVYPRAVFTDLEEFQHSVTKRLSLSFDNETYIPPNIFFNGTPVTRLGLYATYYKNMIEQLKAAPRIREVFVDLKMKDILNLDMRQLVYFQESWWRINKIAEYSPANNQPTKVELIQWLDVGYENVWNGLSGIPLDDGPVVP